jgi:acyl-CoA synthetase (AMP-forming)/AMP-acid ligase II
MMVTVEACEEIDINIALQYMPRDHIALASDWPHYDGTPELLAGFRKATAGSRRGRRPHARDGHARALVPVALRPRGVRIRRNAAERPSTRARRAASDGLTTRDFDRLVNRTAHALAARGARERAAAWRSCCRTTSSSSPSRNAAAKLGALAVPINYRWRRDELAYVLADCGADVLVVDAAFCAKRSRRSRRGRRRRDRVLVLGDASGLDVVRTRDRRRPTRRQRRAPRASGYNIVIYTSGTTGRPKGVVHPHVDPRSASPRRRGLVEMWGFRPDDVHLMVGPAYHTMPGAYVAQQLFVGAASVLMKKFDAEECLRSIDASA